MTENMVENLREILAETSIEDFAAIVYEHELLQAAKDMRDRREAINAAAPWKEIHKVIPHTWVLYTEAEVRSFLEISYVLSLPGWAGKTIRWKASIKKDKLGTITDVDMPSLTDLAFYVSGSDRTFTLIEALSMLPHPKWDLESTDEDEYDNDEYGVCGE